MYRYSQQMRQNTKNSGFRFCLVAVLLVLALAGCAVLGIAYSRSAGVEAKTRQQLLARVRGGCADAKNLVDKMPASVQSNTASQLANVRQNIYAMDQMNGVSIALFGEEGRLVPAEAISALYDDLDTYFSVIQTNTDSVMQIKDQLRLHLSALQTLLSQ